MKRKIVMKVSSMDCAGCKKTVMRTAARIEGVTSVRFGTLKGNDMDQVEVVGDGVDPVKLTTRLRVKLKRDTELISVEEVHENTEKDEEGGGKKKDKGGGGKGGGGSEKKDEPDDSEKDKEGGGRSGEKNYKASGELRKMGANKVYGGWFMYGPGTYAEAVLDEPKPEEWLPTVVH